MEQTSFLSAENLAFPLSYDDLYSLYKRYIYEGEKDDDAFTWSEIKNGRSYFMYGKKVLEYYPGNEKKAKLRVFSLDNDRPDTLTADAYPSTILNAFGLLKEMKKRIFRNTITETFACCHDFVNCSNQKECLHQDDRFYNGCMYRTNLESGRIFYGDNKNA